MLFQYQYNEWPLILPLLENIFGKQISQVFTGNATTILNKLAEHVMKNDSTVEQGLKIVGDGMEISRSSIQLCNNFMQANKAWIKAYNDSQSQYISHLSR